MRRAFQTSLLIAFFALLSACATLPPPPKTISVTEARLAQMIASQFPFNSEMLEVLDVVVSTPRISLDPTNNRINTSLDINVAGNNLLGLFTDKQYKGALDMSYGLRFEPRDATVRLTDVRVHRLDIDGAPSAMRRPIESWPRRSRKSCSRTTCSTRCARKTSRPRKAGATNRALSVSNQPGCRSRSIPSSADRKPPESRRGPAGAACG
jgi:hypothetical protein